MAKKNKKSAVEFPEPMSRNEAILQNILGANNVILPPMSRIEVLLIALGEAIEESGSHLTHETWTFTLNDNTTVEKEVVLWQSTSQP